MSPKILILAGVMLFTASGLFALGTGSGEVKVQTGATCNAFLGSVSAGSVQLTEVSSRLEKAGGYSEKADPAPVDLKRGGRVEVAAFGLG